MNRYVIEGLFGVLVNYSVPLVIVLSFISGGSNEFTTLELARISSAFFIFQLVIQTLVYNELRNKNFFRVENLTICILCGVSIIYFFHIDISDFFVLSLFSPISYILAISKKYFSEISYSLSDVIFFVISGSIITSIITLFSVTSSRDALLIDVVAIMRITFALLGLFTLKSYLRWKPNERYNFIRHLIPFSGVVLIFVERYFLGEVISILAFSGVWMLISEWVYRSAGLINLFQYSIIKILREKFQLSRKLTLYGLLICNTVFALSLLLPISLSYLLIQCLSILPGSILMLILISKNKLELLGIIWLIECALLSITWIFFAPLTSEMQIALSVSRFILDANLLIIGVYYVEKKQATIGL